MTSAEVSFQNMKENSFATAPQTPTATATEPTTPGLVEAFLELEGEDEDACSSESDEEFLDFQFRIADANANLLQERETSEHNNMADWRASFASLQLKQAHEVAEFALARRREDELKIDRQAKEIIELRKSLEAAKMETERVYANCALITEDKIRLEDALTDQLQICHTFRENISEISKAQDLLSGENMELKRALDEAVVTTGRLKYALEEKAAELVAWLGLDGVSPLGLATQSCEDELSPRTEEKEAYRVPGDSPLRSEDGQDLKNVLIDEELFEAILVSENANQDLALTSATQKLMIAIEEEFADMKHEVLVSTPKLFKSRKNLQDLKLLSQKDREESGIDIPNSKKRQALVTLRQKIVKLQSELDRLQSEVNASDEWDVKKNFAQSQAFGRRDDKLNAEGRLSDASSSSNGQDVAVVTEVMEPAPSVISAEETRNDAGDGGVQMSGQDEPRESVVDAVAVAGETKQPGSPSSDLQMTEMQFSESFASLEIDDSLLAPGEAPNSLEDKFICVNRNQPWSVSSISLLVEAITEELTKLLRVVGKAPTASNEASLTDLETRVNAWSNVTSKTLHTKLLRNGAVEEWKDLAVDLLGQSRQELMSVQQRLCDCESELGLMDKCQAESLTANQTITSLEDEIDRLEAQSFSDQIEREEEVNLLKDELAQARHETAQEQRTVDCLRAQLRKSETELEKLGWAAEQEFINSCFGGGRDDPDADERMIRREEIGRMEKKLEDLMARLEENERELGELLIISGVDSDAVVSAKIRRLEQRLEDAKASEEVLAAEKTALISLVDSLKVRLSEVEYELEMESQQHVDMLVRYEEEQGHLEASTRSATGMVHAKLTQMEHLLAEKTKELELAQGGQELSASQTQLLALRARVLSLESHISVTRQKAVDCEATIKSQISKEKDKNAVLESKFAALQSEAAMLKTLLSESEQRERRGQINVDKLMVELGIAKEEVLRYEVRLQKLERQAKEDLEIEKRKHEETIGNQKQIEWHLCRQLELTEGLEREKGKLRDVLEEFELQNLALQKESDNLRTAYMQLARQMEQRSRFC